MAGPINFRVEIDEGQINHVNKMLYTMPEKARAVFKNAITRGLQAGETQARREVRERYAISNKNLMEYSSVRLNHTEAMGSDVVGSILFAGGKIPLYKFHPQPKERKYTNRFVNGKSGWRITTPVSAEDARASGMHRLSRGFIATFQSGHKGIFQRTNGKTKSGKERIKEYYGFSLPDMLDFPEARENVEARMEEITSKRIDQELTRILNGF
jgi:hypothetical protein